MGLTRRQALGVMGAGIASGALNIGCPTAPQNPGESRTGVRGLDTPREILNNRDVSDTIDEMRDHGYKWNPITDEIDPPFIQGRYDIAGEVRIPFQNPLAPGTFRWRNQTVNNHIESDYEQLFGGGGTQTGISPLGEIIRGFDDSFTVYSIVDISTSIPGVGTAKNRNVLIFDGLVDNIGTYGYYFSVPTQNFTPSISNPIPSAGTFEFDYLGPAKDSGDKRVVQPGKGVGLSHYILNKD